MSESLRTLSTIEYGASPKEIRAKDYTSIGIYGTGGLVGYSERVLFEGPLVVVARKGTLDNPMFVAGDCWVIDTAFAVLPKDDVDAKWLYYQLSNYDLRKLNESTGVPSISRDYLYRLSFEKLSLPEQRKIARILSTVDSVVEKTEAAIAKYKAIKQGMMRDLFTRGLDRSGKLRPRYEDVPDLYKLTELGWVPREWEVVRLGDVCDVTSSKRIYLHEYVAVGIPFYRSLEIILKSENQEIADTLYISEDRYGAIKSQYGAPEYGDILITSVGTLGVSYRVTKEDLFYFKDGNLIWFRKFIDRDYSEFLQYTLDELVKMQFDRITIGTSQPAFTIEKLKKLDILVPKREEYRAICHVVAAINRNILSEQTCLKKSQQLKLSLMGDLLTGRVPVKVEEERAEAE